MMRVWPLSDCRVHRA